MRRKLTVFAVLIFGAVSAALSGIALPFFSVRAQGAETSVSAETAQGAETERGAELVQGAETVQGAELTVREIWEYEFSQAGVSDYGEFLSSVLVPAAGEGGEWLLICLRQTHPELDYGGYLKALDAYERENQDLKAADHLRIALARAAVGGDRETVEGAIRLYAGSDGVMSYVYGLIAADSGEYLNDGERLELARGLAGMQLEDGGFAVNGRHGDADVTAMALQALAPYKKEFGSAIDMALERLSHLQKENGGFASYGTENAESCAQVLIALCALNLDYREDSRFIKGSRTVWDALCDFSCAGGGFSHNVGGLPNKMATVQVLEAAICLERYKAGKGFIYDFSKGSADGAETGGASEVSADGAETGNTSEGSADGTEAGDTSEGNSASAQKITGTVIKIIIVSVICVCALTAVIVFLVSHKGKGTLSLLWIIVPAAVLLTATVFSRIETKDEHYASINAGGSMRTRIAVTGYEGVILSEREVKILPGGTVFEQLQSALAAERINLDYGGNIFLGNVYVRGIGGLSEFDYGSLSGWTYRVNGEYPNVSCAVFVLSENDFVEWIYQTGDDSRLYRR